MPLNNNVILITGAARRIGAVIAQTLHAAGGRIILHYRGSATDALALAASLNELRPHSAAVVQADLLQLTGFPRLLEEAAEKFGRLDALVNNASTFYPTPVGTIDADVWNDIVGSNFQAPLFLAQAAVPYLRKARGAIVNITDIHAERPLKDYPLYSAAKAGLLGLTRALALELAPEIRVNAVAPGAILWPGDGQFADTARQAIVEHTLLQRMGSPGDIARTVLFLLADAPYITGQVINVDGGRTAHL